MQQIVLFSVLGLGSGALIAGIAVALVVTYRGSGVINLSMGAVAMVSAYACWALRAGELGFKLATVPAAVVAVLFTVLLGVLMEFLVFQPLRLATPVAKVVASLGILLGLQSAVTLAFGPYPQQEPTFLPTSTFNVFTVPVPVDHVLIAGVVIVCAIIVTCLYRFTRFGLATRAGAENQVSSVLIGLSPRALALANTCLACLIVGILGVLAGVVTSLDPNSLPLQIVPALVAALFARFTSIPIACAVGLALGAGENLLYYASTQSWYPNAGGAPIPGLQELIEFLLIALALFIRGSRLPRRGDIVERRLPPVPIPARVFRPAVLTALLTAVLLIVLPYDYRAAMEITVVAFVLTLSVVVITGFVGQISVAQLALSGVSAFILAHVAASWHLGFPLGAIVGILGATVIGSLIGISALRIRGVQLAVVTLAAAVAIEQFWFNNPTWGASDTGQRVSAPTIFGINFGNSAPFKGLDGAFPSPMMGFLLVAVALALGLVVTNLRRTKLGQRMLAVRSNEAAAAAAGIRVSQVKIAAFTLSSFIAGVAGVMSAYNFGSVSANNYDAITGLGIIAFAYLGGVTMVSGAIIASLVSVQALVPHLLQQELGISGEWALLIGAVLLISNLVFYPEGIAGSFHGNMAAIRQKRQALIGTIRGPALAPAVGGGVPEKPGKDAAP